MISSSPLENETLRLRAIMALIAMALVFLALWLLRVQVFKGSEQEQRATKQSVRRVRLPGARGAILDRHGTCLAENRANFCIAVYAEELRQPGKWEKTVGEVDQVIGKLATILEVEPEVTREEIRSHISKRLPLPFLAWRNLDAEALAKWAEKGQEVPGVDIHVEPVRHYPYGQLAAHILGFVGRAEETRDADDPYHFYLPEMEGKRGIEKVFNDRLAGVAGGRLIRVDAAGFKHDEQGEREPVKGQDVTLTLDAGTQGLAEEILSGMTGAAVVVDCRNGDVLAMASAPSFDLVAARDKAEYQRLRKDEGNPLFNRAISGMYPPGSTFKPLVALTALSAAGIGPETAFECVGYYALGPVHFNCWLKTGHGPLQMRKAIEQSCNAYFCQLGLACGYRRICQMADAFGFGRCTGIDLDQESSGLVPDGAWKQKRFHDLWRSGDTCNLSIGQGWLLATPLQMALFVAAIANGGHVYRPRIVMEPWGEGDLIKKMPWTEAALGTVRGGMFDVVENEEGTGKRARVRGVHMGGKTGTAQYGPVAAQRKYGWMIAFAPFEAPRVGAAIVLENVNSGGRDAAPRMGRLMAGIFGVKPAMLSEQAAHAETE